MKLTIELDVPNCDRRQLNNALAKIENDIHHLIKYDENGMEEGGIAYGKEYNLKVEIFENEQ